LAREQIPLWEVLLPNSYSVPQSKAAQALEIEHFSGMFKLLSIQFRLAPEFHPAFARCADTGAGPLGY
jgi:hypothetical protein